MKTSKVIGFIIFGLVLFKVIGRYMVEREREARYQQSEQDQGVETTRARSEASTRAIKRPQDAPTDSLMFVPNSYQRFLISQDVDKCRKSEKAIDSLLDMRESKNSWRRFQRTKAYERAILNSQEFLQWAKPRVAAFNRSKDTSTVEAARILEETSRKHSYFLRIENRLR